MMALLEIRYYKVFFLFVFSGVAFSQSEEVLFNDLSGRVDELILRIDRLNSIANKKPQKAEVLSTNLTSSSDLAGSNTVENLSPSMTLPNQSHISAFENLEPREIGRAHV